MNRNGGRLARFLFSKRPRFFCMFFFVPHSDGVIRGTSRLLDTRVLCIMQRVPADLRDVGGVVFVPGGGDDAVSVCRFHLRRLASAALAAARRLRGVAGWASCIHK